MGKAMAGLTQTAFAKYHVVILVIQLFEHIAAKHYDKVILDKLTLDPFQAAASWRPRLLLPMTIRRLRNKCFIPPFGPI
jgi:hypothetical protein